MSEAKSMDARNYTRRDFIRGGMVHNSMADAERSPGGGERVVSPIGRFPDRSSGHSGNHRSARHEAYGRFAIAYSAASVIAAGALIAIRMWGHW